MPAAARALTIRSALQRHTKNSAEATARCQSGQYEGAAQHRPGGMHLFQMPNQHMPTCSFAVRTAAAVAAASCGRSVIKKNISSGCVNSR